jgi:predicted MFS family arabinose efflux permease
MNKNALAKSAFRFVLTIGIVNLLADFTYEGGRSIVGPFLGSLGASGTIVGFVAGLGEFIGYALRSISGYFADRTAKYWPVAWCGYVVNQLAIPALALAGNWPLAAACVISERTGRAIRKPAMDAMLSHAGESIGAGWVFGLNEALDQAGATLGPLLVAALLFSHRGYRIAFGAFLGPALLCLTALLIARLLYPHPHQFGKHPSQLRATTGLTKAFWIYLTAGGLIAAGLADFSLIGFHFQKANVVSANLIPIFYAVAMASSALSSLLFGRLFDKFGRVIVLVAFSLSAAFAPLVFLGRAPFALFGMMLWGIGMGAEGSLLKALLTSVVAAQKRSTAFGLFDTGYGIAWFLGSALMGVFYDKSIAMLVIFSVVAQLAALPIFLLANDRKK